MRNQLTVSQAAKAAGCSTSHINRLIKLKQIAAVQAHPHAHWTITMSRTAIKELVQQNTRVGYKKKPRSTFTTLSLEPDAADAILMPAMPRVEQPDKLETLLRLLSDQRFVALVHQPPDKLKALLDLAEKFNTDQLQLLVIHL